MPRWTGEPVLRPSGRSSGSHRPGAFAEYVAVPANQCHRVPDSLTDLTAALTEPLACGMRAVAQSQINAGETLLILGAGSIGLLCLLAARDTGVEHIIISDTSPQNALPSPPNLVLLGR